MRILVLYDGKLGHLSQSYGFAQLIASRLPADVTINTCSAKARLKLLNKPLRQLACLPSSQASRAVLSGYTFADGQPSRADMVVSFGGNVVALNIALSRCWGVPNILIGNSYGLPPSLIAVHATAQGSDADNAVATGVALSKTDPAFCQRAGQLLARSANTPLWTLLVGGDGSGYHYSKEDWQQLGRAMQTLSERHGIRWLVSTSRRTDAVGVEALRRYATPQCCEAAIWYGVSSTDSLDAYLGAGERLFCTEDSMSMLSEAVAMSKPVVSLRPGAVCAKRVHSAMLTHLEDSGLIQRESVNSVAMYHPAHFEPVRSYPAQLDDIYRQVVEKLALPVQLDATGKRRPTSTAAAAH